MKYLCDPTKTASAQSSQNHLLVYNLLENTNQYPTQSDGLQHPNIKVFCIDCNKEISKHNKVKYWKGMSCVGCFSKNQQLPLQFQVTKKYEFSIFESTWNAYQQVLLLHSIQKLGFGNWKQIKDYMQYFGTKFTEEEIQTHYNTFYLCDKTFIPKISQILIQRQRRKESQISTKIKSIPVSIASLTTHRDDSINYPFQYIDDFSNDQVQLAPLSLQNKTNQVVGYNQKRNEFDVNFDQDAQKLLANLEFREDDLPEEQEVKFQIIKMYTQRTKKRNQIQDFVVEHKLLDAQYQKQVTQNRTQYQKIAADQLNSFMRFSSFSEHNQLVKRMALSIELKSIIQGLRKLRRTQNISSLKQVKSKMKMKNQHKTTKTKFIQKQRGRGRPRKLIQFDKMTEPSQQVQKINNCFIQKMGINLADLQIIIKRVNQVQQGEKIKYGHLEALIVNTSKNGKR